VESPTVYQLGPKAPLLERGECRSHDSNRTTSCRRFGLKIPIRVRIAKPAAREHTAESLNISKRGIYFATDLPLHKGTPVHSPSRCRRSHIISPRPNALHGPCSPCRAEQFSAG